MARLEEVKAGEEMEVEETVEALEEARVVREGVAMAGATAEVMVAGMVVVLVAEKEEAERAVV